jgi:hypothetical protein
MAYTRPDHESAQQIDRVGAREFRPKLRSNVRLPDGVDEQITLAEWRCRQRRGRSDVTKRGSAPLGAALAWLAILTSVTTGATGFAAAHPDVQARLCELSPLAPLFDAAGWDWMRANALSYRLAGAEWVARRPWNGALAATATVVVGCTSALLLPKLGRRGAASARS